MGLIARCECGMPHLGGTEHADECPAGVYVPGLGGGGGSEVEALREQLRGAVEALEALARGRVLHEHGYDFGVPVTVREFAQRTLDNLGGQYEAE